MEERGQGQVERTIFQWITRYNEERLHSALDYVPPAEYGQAFWRIQEQTPQSVQTKITGSLGSSGQLSRAGDPIHAPLSK
ncbi:integrase core domain-containing protein [Streptomyces sp. NPDC058872]|uniref:integrase core domain-containing protein n=1 Tax=Streptomyces sp. NPDC058872 TaxID=3346661 RepID=UPI0036A9AC0F